MRVLIAVHGFPPLRSAGAERRAERMADWLAANGHHVEVFAIERVDEPRFQVERTSHGRGASYAVHRVSFDAAGQAGFFHNSYDYPPIGEALRAVLKAGRFDLVHLICGYLLAAQTIDVANRERLPVVFTLTEFWPMCARLNLLTARGVLCDGPETPDKCVRCLAEDKRRFRLLAHLAPPLADLYWSVARARAARARARMVRRQGTLRGAVVNADLVVCPSRFLMGKYAEFGFDTARFVFMRQGLSGIPEKRRATRERTERTLKLAYVGQIKPHKGVDLAVEAIRGLVQSGRDVSLDIWGSEAEASGYVAQLKQRSARTPAIRWRGQYAGHEVWGALAAADVLVMPSRWYENSPNAILEAYAAGLPVVATDLGGMAELVEHDKSGLLFRCNDASSLRQQLARLVDDPTLLTRLREGIPGVTTLDQEMQAVVAAYHRLLARPSRASAVGDHQEEQG